MQDIQQSAPLCQVLNEDSTMRTMLSLFMPHLRLDSQAIKLQCNAGIAFAVSFSIAEYHNPFRSDAESIYNTVFASQTSELWTVWSIVTYTCVKHDLAVTLLSAHVMSCERRRL